jgi:beta-carotene ketolase (CrtO type)
MSLDQLLSFRPSPSLSGYRVPPIGGLFLTGAGTHPGGGVTGLPGRNAAAVVLDALGGTGGAASRARRLRRRLALVRDAARALRTLRRGGPR